MKAYRMWVRRRNDVPKIVQIQTLEELVNLMDKTDDRIDIDLATTWLNNLLATQGEKAVDFEVRIS